MADGDDDLETRVLVQAPTARDAVATRDILAAVGVASVVCPTLADVCREAARGAGAAVLTAEAVLADKGCQLATLLQGQPPWSDLPLIVLTPPGAESPKILRELEAVGSMTLMKRPVQVSTILSTIRAALRDRRRQYEVRELLAAQARSEGALRASEERLRLIVESATDYAILTLDPDRTVRTWSPGAAATFGYAAAEIVGRSGDELFTPEDRAAGVPEAEADEAARAGRAADERWHNRKDGTRFYASGVMRPLWDGGGFVKVLRDLTDRKRMEDELRDSRDKLEVRVAERTADLGRALDALEAEMDRRRDLARRLATAQEDERRRVARDLHDTVGQLMAGLSMGFKAIETGGDLPPPAAARLAETQRIMGELGRELHGLAVRLRPTSLDDLGLEAALGQLVFEWASRSGVKADFHAAGLGRARLPAEVETTVYRVVQEALTNAAKHAQATRVGVAVTRSGGFVSVVVEDDGTGFDPDAPTTGRLGLLGMRERVELVRGEIDVESRPGAGTTVAVQIPIPAGGGS
jgi:PAS domain S-box-containing protein